MTSLPRILIVGAQHGNERFGHRIYRHLQRHAPEKLAQVDFLCGNPKAYAQGVRFLETDLNRSYAAKLPKSYEEKRAQKILQRVRAGHYDYVLDVHTAVADIGLGRFLIATRFDDSIRHMLGASDLERLVIIPPRVVNGSLEEQLPQAIAIEYFEGLAKTSSALKEMVELIDNLLAGRQLQRPREVYFVEDKIALDAPLEPEALNFVKCSLGYYPVLMDEGSYGTFRGFQAPVRKEIVV